MTFRFILLVFSIVYSVAYASPDKPVAGKQTVEMEGRGFYLTSPAAMFDGNKTLTLNTPVIDWLGDMKKAHLEGLAELDLSDIAAFVHILDTGFKKSLGPYSITLKYRKGDQWKNLELHDQVTHVSSSGGNMRFTFKNKIKSLPDQAMEQVTFVLKTWHSPTVNLGRFPMHSVCCNCSGGCAALWILFAYCNSCLQPMGGEYCCTHCSPPVPAAPGGTCP